MSILLVEQNARAALQVSDYGYVLETGELALEGPSADLAANPRVAATYLGKGVPSASMSERCASPIRRARTNAARFSYARAGMFASPWLPKRRQ